MGSPPTLPDILRSLGDSPDRPPPHPVQHSADGTLLSIPIPGPHGTSWRALWIRDEGIDLLGPAAPTSGLSRSFALTKETAAAVDLLAEAARAYIDGIEGIDEKLADVQSRGGAVPPSELWALQREVAGLRGMIGRALVVLEELSGPSLERFPNAETPFGALSREVDRARNLAATVQQSLSDLIMLRQAEQGNRIAESANLLSRTSNRIAELANTSNIRMLGITYLALVLGLVSAVVLIPNTGATILGMPSAGWVPGWWVNAILFVLAIVPMAIVFTRPWVRRVLRDLAASEHRIAEGLEDLPEISAEGGPPPSSRGSKPY
jgi:hypothetical protein